MRDGERTNFLERLWPERLGHGVADQNIETRLAVEHCFSSSRTRKLIAHFTALCCFSPRVFR